MALSMLKLDGFCRGGYSLKVFRNSPTIACAGTSVKHPVGHPLVVEHRLVGSLERITGQVKHLRQAQRPERHPAGVHALGLLDHEMDLPGADAQRDQIVVVT
jgi:hypothetical protein